MPDTIFTTEVPNNQDFDGNTHHLGQLFTVSADRVVNGGRVWVPAGALPATYIWQLWRVSDQALLAECDINTLPPPTLNDWVSFTSSDFVTPGNINVVSTDSYVVNVFTGGDFVFLTPFTYPIGTGVVSSSAGRSLDNQPRNTFPTTVEANTALFADVNVDVAGVSGTLDVTLPALVVDNVGLVTVSGTLDATLPALSVAATGVSAAGGATVDPCGWNIPTPPLCCDAWATFPAAVQSAALDYAATILWAATGRRFGLCEVSVRPCGVKPCPDGSADWFGYDWSSGTWVPYIFNGTWFNCVCPGVCCCDPRCQVWLAGPVNSIVEVTIGGIVVAPTSYRVDDNHWLVRTDGECWPTCADLDTDDGENVFVVTYLRGDPVPQALLTAGGTLACEWAKACVGNGDCRLGNRVTSIARQGVNIEMVSPDDLLDQNLTGVFEVDSLIRAFNPYGLKQRYRILSPEIRWPRTVTSP